MLQCVITRNIVSFAVAIASDTLLGDDVLVDDVALPRPSVHSAGFVVQATAMVQQILCVLVPLPLPHASTVPPRSHHVLIGMPHSALRH